MKTRTQLTALLIPTLIALGITALLIVLVGQSPLVVLQTILRGAVGTPIKRADVLVVWVSVALSAAGLLFTFRAGQWNIGIEGQIALGAIFAIGASRFFLANPTPWAIPVMLLSGMIGGAFWGTLIAILKVFGRVNEIFGGLGFNFIATSLTIYLISGPWHPAGTSSVNTSELLPNALWLPTLDKLRVSPIALSLAAVVLVLVHVALRGTLWGLQLKAVGQNGRAAHRLGLPTTRLLFSAYIVCGLCAGLVGALLAVGVRHQLVTSISAGYGFLGILIVLLSGQNSLLIAPIALFFAGLSIGSTALTLELGLDSSLGGVLIGCIVLAYELSKGYQEKYHSASVQE